MADHRETREPQTFPELREAVAEHRKRLRTCDTQPAAVAWMTRAHELMGICMDRLAKAEEPPPLIVVPQERPRLVIVSNMEEAISQARPVPRGQAGFFDKRVKTFVYPIRPDPPPGSALAPKAWTHADTLRLERESRLNRERQRMAAMEKWTARKIQRAGR